MMKSMTGYGRGECTLYNRKFVVEIKSVNHRYNDISVKMPRVMGNFEEMVRKTVSQAVSRGKTEVYINYEMLGAADIVVNFNEKVADAYVGAFTNIKNCYNLEDKITLSLLVRFPDVISIDKNMDDEKANFEIGEALGKAVDEAVIGLTSMREREGASLKCDMIDKLGFVKELVGKVEARAPVIVENYKLRLSQKLAEALKDIDVEESRLVTEITLFADKACVDEEITRLLSHLNQMAVILEQSDSIGRKLDFLVQEINREVNTIGSKSNDLETTQTVVDMKSEIEKIREQIQNIE